jgi:hypothetical protein
VRDLITDGLQLGAKFYQRGEMAGATSALYIATVQAFALTRDDPTFARCAHFVFRCAVLATMGGPEPMDPTARSALLRTLKAAAKMAPKANSVGLRQLQTAWRAALISLELEGPCKPEP